jgi:hypothetical protein
MAPARNELPEGKLTQTAGSVSGRGPEAARQVPGTAGTVGAAHRRGARPVRLVNSVEGDSCQGRMGGRWLTPAWAATVSPTISAVAAMLSTAVI